MIDKASSRTTAFVVTGLAAAAMLTAAAFAARAGETRPAQVLAVAEIGMTVGDIDRSIAFYTNVLGFEKVSQAEVMGTPWERLTGIFGCRIRLARLRLGSETIELADFLTPRGRPFPYDTQADDHWFQHIAIVVSDIDAAYERLRAAGVEHASTAPQRLPDTIPAAAGIRAF
jgi:catechol 2,3-dioxygenase-like lactoylglutathione lyase family enzyme